MSWWAMGPWAMGRNGQLRQEVWVNLEQEYLYLYPSPPSLFPLAHLLDAVSTLHLSGTISTIIVWVPGQTLARILMQRCNAAKLQRHDLQRRLRGLSH
jgi:hypothetical protein